MRTEPTELIVLSFVAAVGMRSAEGISTSENDGWELTRRDLSKATGEGLEAVCAGLAQPSMTSRYFCRK